MTRTEIIRSPPKADASTPRFSSDGRSLYFLMANGQTDGAELWIKDLSSGTVDRVLPATCRRSAFFRYSGVEHRKAVMKPFDRKVGKRSSGRVASPVITTRLFLPKHPSCHCLSDQLKNGPLGVMCSGIRAMDLRVSNIRSSRQTDHEVHFRERCGIVIRLTNF